MGLNIHAKTDYSSLFAGMNTNSNGYSVSDLSGLLSDYSTIKSGTYGKLMKAYYAKNPSERPEISKPNEPVKKDELVSAQTKTYNKVSTTADALGSAIDALDKEDPDDSLAAVKNFVKSYNNFLGAAEDADNASINGRVDAIKNNTATYSKQLSKLGITTDTAGKMSLNEDTFKSADKKELSSLFASRSAYGYGVKVSAGMAAANAKYEATKTSAYTSKGGYQMSTGSLMDSIM